MEKWDRDLVDMLVPDYIVFDENDSGEFHLGAVHGSMDCRMEPYDDTERVEFSWEGEDEMDAASGRGWALIEENGQIQGNLSFHNGDDSGFTTEKAT